MTPLRITDQTAFRPTPAQFSTFSSSAPRTPFRFYHPFYPPRSLEQDLSLAMIRNALASAVRPALNAVRLFSASTPPHFR